MIGRLPLTLAWTVAWLVLVAVALYARPPLPVDETRYLAVAWEMYVGGDYLVPHLNGAPYSHKPPLLFWLINLGWALFGAVEWWARAVAPLPVLVEYAAKWARGVGCLCALYMCAFYLPSLISSLSTNY